MKGPHYPARWAAGLALLLGLAWWVWPAAVEQARLSVATPEVTAVPALPASASLPAAAPAPAVSERPTYRAPASWDLCGIGRMPVPPGARPEHLTDLPAHLGEQPLAVARERTRAALRAGDVRARAAAMLLRVPTSTDPRPVGEGVGAALIPMVLASHDPVALAWGFTACYANRLGDGCVRQVARAFVEADPDNAAAWGPWIRWSPEPESAWRRMLQASRWDSHFGAFTRTVAAAIPPDVPGYLRAALLYETVLIEPLLSPMPGGAWAQRCSTEPQTAPPGDCDRLATLLAERGDTLITLTLGRSLGRKAGWPAERVAALEAELQSLSFAGSAFLNEHIGQPLSCDALQHWERRVASLAVGGELQHLRDERQRQRTR